MMELLKEKNIFLKKVYSELSRFDNHFVETRPDGGWSPKEILGHLIDSASNNHQRFIRAQTSDELVFDGYDQDFWVKAHNYQSADWSFLLGFWLDYNLLLIHILENIPTDILSLKRTKHNCDKIAFKTVSTDRAVTLDYFIKDYYEHLEHHIKQVYKLIGQ